MYIKSLRVKNFRKFKSTGNEVQFVSKGIGNKIEEDFESVANATTLIVGKNNAGKTTITKALECIVGGSKNIRGNDFNFQYLQRVLEIFDPKKNDNILPELEFSIVIHISNTKKSSLGNLIYFIDSFNGSIPESMDITIKTKVQIKEENEFSSSLSEIKKKYKNQTRLQFSKLISLINKTEFKVFYYDEKNKQVTSSNFKISDIIEIKSISANKNLNGTNLAKVFNKIIKKKYKSPSSNSEYNNLIDEIDKLNIGISENISNTHNSLVNNVLGKVESSDTLNVSLTSDLDFEKLMTNLIKYEFDEAGIYIPEDQYGLGYTNLVSIVGEIIDYIEDCPDDLIQHKVNLICIEEPEAFMHPQMQENFIKYIDDAIKTLMAHCATKSINSQIIITSHSAHILNSKIHSSNSFDNISYVTTRNGDIHVVNLNDSELHKKGKKRNNKEETQAEYLKRKRENLKFLKTHIKFKVSELFFSDAVIFVEGVTEETILNFYIDKNPSLKNKYISVFNIDGAHGLVYQPLLTILGIPTLIVTDLDILRTEKEKREYSQVNDLNLRKTTNATINYFSNDIPNLKYIEKYYTNKNVRCVYQIEQTNGYYASSLEEAIILMNWDNEIIKSALRSTKKNTYSQVTRKGESIKEIIHSSYLLQRKLSSDKSKFSNNLLYELCREDDKEKHPELPSYIKDGIFWLGLKTQDSY